MLAGYKLTKNDRTNSSVPAQIISSAETGGSGAELITLVRYLPPYTRLVLDLGPFFVAKSIFVDR